MCITEIVLSLLTNAVQRIRKNSGAARLFAKPVLLCTATANSATEVVHDKSFAVRLNVPKTVNVHAITRIGTTARKTMAAPNMSQYPMIIVFP